MHDQPFNFTRSTPTPPTTLATSATSSPRRAVLVFAQNLGHDTRRRRWDRRLAGRLCQVDAAGLATAGADVHLFGDAAAIGLPRDRVHEQIDGDFGTRLLAAAETLAQLGYDEVCLVGGDCPQLTQGDVVDAFAGLSAGAPLVLGPDHRGGCYLIALRLRDCRRLLTGVAWRQDTDFAELSDRVEGRAFVLAQKVDVDAPADVKFLCRRDRVWRDVLRRLFGGIAATFSIPAPSAANVRQRALWQLPPPRAA